MTQNYEGNEPVSITIEHGAIIAGTPVHEPDPEWVDVDDLDMVNVCDFCSAPGPVWTYPVGPLMVTLTPTEDYVDDGEWYACDACYQDIERDRWQAVIERWAERNNIRPAANKVAMIKMAGFLRAFVKARNGPPRRIHHQHA